MGAAVGRGRATLAAHYALLNVCGGCLSLATCLFPPLRSVCVNIRARTRTCRCRLSASLTLALTSLSRNVLSCSEQ